MDATTTRKALFDLFERLTNRALRKSRAQEQVAPASAEASKPFAVPADVALPATRNLDIGSSNETQKRRNPQEVNSCGPTNSETEKAAGRGGGGGGGEETVMSADGKEDSLVNGFPAGNWYPFTFKMMLHKLYKLEEWAMKVKDVLEKSRQDYRPLSEVDGEEKDSGSERRQEQPGREKPECRTRGDSYSGATKTRRNPSSGEIGPEKGLRRTASVQVGHKSLSTHDDGKKTGAVRNPSCGERVIKKRYVDGRRQGAVTLVRVADYDCHKLGNAGPGDDDKMLRQFDSVGDQRKPSNSVNFMLAVTEACVRNGGSGLLPSSTDSQASHARKRVLSEADITGTDSSSPRKRPYLL